MIVFAQFSDTHLDGGPRRAGRAAAVMSCLNGLSRPLDAVLVTGDIANHGRPSEYEQAREILAASRAPVFTCPGNHDARSAFRQVLLGEDAAQPPDAAQPADAPVNRVYHAAGAVFALCDSTIPGQVDGALAEETIGWLDGVLERWADRPAFLCFHHPPRLARPYHEDLRHLGEDRLPGLLARHSQVAAILCGHAHSPAATTFAGCPVRVAPGVFSTLLLPWDHGDILDEQAPPGFALHVLDDDQQLTTHYRFVA
jgi:Icc protein